MSFWELYGSRFLPAVGIHLAYVLVSVSIAFVIGMALAILLSRMPQHAKWLLPLLSLFQTIPGIVFVGLLFIWIGMKATTIIIALSVYAIFPILKNAYTGLVDVPEQYKEAAKGIGMSPVESLVRVEIPLALPTIFGGLRMSTIYTVSWAVLAAMIGMGGLGDFIYTGINSNNNLLILMGAIPAAVMAIVLGWVLDKIQNKLVSPGLEAK